MPAILPQNMRVVERDDDLAPSRTLRNGLSSRRRGFRAAQLGDLEVARVIYESLLAAKFLAEVDCLTGSSELLLGQSLLRLSSRAQAEGSLPISRSTQASLENPYLLYLRSHAFRMRSDSERSLRVAGRKPRERGGRRYSSTYVQHNKKAQSTTLCAFNEN